jgi:hypothetical protein
LIEAAWKLGRFHWPFLSIGISSPGFWFTSALFQSTANRRSSSSKIIVNPAWRASELDGFGNSMIWHNVPRRRLPAPVDLEEFGLSGIPT